ncbi:MAG: hypothetical protein V4541_02455 [Bacteroidota bacterium]
MNIPHFLTTVLMLAIGGSIVVIVAYFLVKNDIQNYFRWKHIVANKDNSATLLPLRLQAHERLIVFIERINPPNLFLRLHQPGIGIKELQTLVLNEIRAEYQHNITQQLYVSAIAWDVVRKLKDDTIAMVNNVVQGLPAEATGVELSKKVLQHMSTIEENPYELTANLLKREIHQLF